MIGLRPGVWRTLRVAVAVLAGTGTASMIGLADLAAAKSGRDGKREEATYLRPAATPVTAVISINQQRITVYDSEGAMLRSPVSTGKPGYETPPGIFTVLEKKVEHYSNVYLDAAMPYMQRITWSGIALHAGVLPGHPASGGCIRLPTGFAERLFERTKLGMRVIVVRDDISPAEIAHPALFKPLGDVGPVTANLSPGAAVESGNRAVVDASVAVDPAPAQPRQSLRSIASAKSAEAAAATKRAEDTRRAAAKATKDAALSAKMLRRAEAAKARAEAQSRQAERRAEDAQGLAAERAQEAKTAAQATLAAAEAQLAAAKAEAESAQELAVRLRPEIKAAEAAKTAALDEAKEAGRKLAPVSVFISRKTQRLYVRQAREPLFESEVAIKDADSPLGTYVFTAVEYARTETELRWSVLSMYRTAKGPDLAENGKRPRSDRHAAAVTADLAGARQALDRVVIPKEAVDRISEVVSPGSSLVISDEPLSRETGKGTDFIVVMSNEPQGGLKIRRPRSPTPGYRHRRYDDREPYAWRAPSFWW